MPTLDFYYRHVLGRRLQSSEMDWNNQLYSQAYDTIVSISASLAAAANFKGNWSALTGPLAVPASVYHNSQYWMLRENVANVAAEQPGVSSKWALFQTGNVQGPASAVDGNGVVFDGATGKLLKSLGAAPVKKSGDTMTGALLAVAGTVSAPGLAISGDTNTGIYSPGADQLSISTGGVHRLSVDASGNVLVRTGVLGYGSGAGGTVTQHTSKSTDVTINKLCGQITMDASALAAGASVTFHVNNSYYSFIDVVVLHGSYGAVNPSNYRIEPTVTAGNGFAIRVTNISAGSLSQAVQINFAILKVSAT